MWGGDAVRITLRCSSWRRNTGVLYLSAKINRFHVCRSEGKLYELVRGQTKLSPEFMVIFFCVKKTKKTPTKTKNKPQNKTCIHWEETVWRRRRRRRKMLWHFPREIQGSPSRQSTKWNLRSNCSNKPPPNEQTLVSQWKSEALKP